MTLSYEERNAVVNYRVEKAKETITEVENIATLGYEIERLFVENFDTKLRYKLKRY
jgi:hypothetical protein